MSNKDVAWAFAMMLIGLLGAVGAFGVDLGQIYRTICSFFSAFAGWQFMVGFLEILRPTVEPSLEEPGDKEKE